MMDRASGYDWIGTRVRASSYALSSTVEGKDQLGSDNPFDTSGTMSSPHSPAVESSNVFTVKSMGKIVDFCPGIGEHFVLFDEELLAPRWLSLNACNGQCDVEVILEWAIAQDEKICPASSARHRNSSKSSATSTPDGEPKCQLCHRGTILGVHGVVTCFVCGIRHLHRHCMPMSRMQLSENQEWRCWHCTCNSYQYLFFLLMSFSGCQGCGTSSWVAPLQTTSMQIVLNDPTAPSENVGFCQKCIDRYQASEKDFCQICYRWYSDLDKTFAQHPLAAETTIDDLAHADVSGEEDDRMVSKFSHQSRSH